MLHSISCILSQPGLHPISHHRARDSLQRRADGSSTRALDSTTETETHHNDGAVSVACDQSQIESLSVGQGSADIRSATSCKAKKRLCLQSYKSAQVLSKGCPGALWYLQVVRVWDLKCAMEGGGRRLDFQKRGHREPSALAEVLVYNACICVRYLVLVRPTTKAEE